MLRELFASARIMCAVYSSPATHWQGSGRSHCCISAEHTITGWGPTHLHHGKQCTTPISTSTWSAIFIHGAAMPSENCPKNTLSSVSTQHAPTEEFKVEVAFLGWHDSTPTAWIYSFCIQLIL
eukprot:3240717-Rhodomonas_salina.1